MTPDPSAFANGAPVLQVETVGTGGGLSVAQGARTSSDSSAPSAPSTPSTVAPKAASPTVPAALPTATVVTIPQRGQGSRNTPTWVTLPVLDGPAHGPRVPLRKRLPVQSPRLGERVPPIRSPFSFQTVRVTEHPSANPVRWSIDERPNGRSWPSSDRYRSHARLLGQIAWLMDRAITVPGTRLDRPGRLARRVAAGRRRFDRVVQTILVLVALTHYRPRGSIPDVRQRAGRHRRWHRAGRR